MADPGPYHLLMLLGASAVVLSVVGEPPVHPGFALAGFLLWILGVSRLLLFGQIGLRPLSTGALVAAAANLAVERRKHFVFGRSSSRPALRRAVSSYHFLVLLGASVVVFSVVGKPPAQAAGSYALAGFQLWFLGLARLMLFGQIALRPLFPGALAAAADANPAAEKLKHIVLGRRDPAPVV
ncbi:hypothetical protein BAE44_0016588 [Dichanthelium oligosanthes]|uniref:Uncharacterized protein n=1 Tax=Dichanthelium oligosanthes TaxID=888268 RepID=A0A1E5VBK5_9POAL|nr:hypothetical protein BAE44_0016588 [Dichanthelium oligosanthes]